jgi:hemolysin III
MNAAIRAVFNGTHSESFAEELVNSGTHLVAAVMSVVGLYFLIVVSVYHRRSWHHVVGCVTFAVSCLLLYIASASYHAIGAIAVARPERWLAELKESLRVVDHIGIYIMIAGTYTSVVLLILVRKGGYVKLGLSVLVGIWICAIGGMFAKVLFNKEDIPDYLSNGFYLFMGWFITPALLPLVKTSTRRFLWWMGGGGFAYTAGVWFLMWDKLHYNHGLWHLCVMAGSYSHFIGVLEAAVPGPGPRSDKPVCHSATFARVAALVGFDATSKVV